MQHYRIIFLLLSSLVFSSCAYHRLAPSGRDAFLASHPINPVIPSSGAIKYKTSIDFLNKHFTGVIVLKQTDIDTKHLVFVTELGMRMFDFEIKGDSMKPVFVFEPLNKPKVVDALVRNFTNILMEWGKTSEIFRSKSGKELIHLFHSGHLNDNVIMFCDTNHYITEQWVFYKRKKKSKTIYKNNYDKIKLKQYGLVKLFIELEKIND